MATPKYIGIAEQQLVVFGVVIVISKYKIC